MRKIIWKRLLCVGLVTGLTTGFLTGCGEEKDVDYRIDGVMEEAQTGEHGGKSEVGQFADEKNWSEVWTITENVNEAVEVTVDADIILPEAEEMSVVEVKVPEFGAEYKEKLLKRMFQGEIYYGDAEHIPEEDLEENYIPAEEYEIDLYIGKRDGKRFQVFFYADEAEEVWQSITQGILYAARDFEDICPKGYEKYTTYKEHPYVSSFDKSDMTENECELSEAEAEELARGFVDVLGLEYPILAYTKPLLWGDDSISEENAYNWPANGYVFHYEYGVEDILFSGYGKEAEYTQFSNWKLGEESQYSMAAELTVYVTEQGVIQMNVHNPIETTDVTENVKLLPLDAVKEIMREETQKEYEQFRFLHSVRNTELYFNRMELIYFRVRDKENAGQYSYVPAWRLSDQFGLKEMNNRSIRNPIIVNAIDGTLINFYEET